MSQQGEALLISALSDFFVSQRAKESQVAQSELNRFIRWCGRDRPARSLTPLAIEEYSGTFEGTGEESGSRLAIIKKFLNYLHHQGITAGNLAPHAKLRRGGRGASLTRKSRRQGVPVRLTAEGIQKLETELASLKADRVQVAQAVRRAAADKDVSENAPLDAAREQQGHLEARIGELEGVLKVATLLEQERGGNKVTLGSKVVLRHADTGQETTYLLVGSTEADPTNGKLSVASPVGKAILNQTVGSQVDVATPRGAVRYLIANVES